MVGIEVADKAPLVQAQCTGVSTETMLASVACHSDTFESNESMLASVGGRSGKSERQLEPGCRHIHGVETFLGTCWYTHLAETHFVVDRRMYASAIVRVSAAPCCEQSLGDPDKTLARARRHVASGRSAMGTADEAE